MFSLLKPKSLELSTCLSWHKTSLQAFYCKNNCLVFPSSLCVRAAAFPTCSVQQGQWFLLHCIHHHSTALQYVGTIQNLKRGKFLTNSIFPAAKTQTSEAADSPFFKGSCSNLVQSSHNGILKVEPVFHHSSGVFPQARSQALKLHFH